MKHRNDMIAPLALAAAISLTAGACEAGDSGGGTRSDEVAPSNRTAAAVAGSASDRFRRSTPS